MAVFKHRFIFSFNFDDVRSHKKYLIETYDILLLALCSKWILKSSIVDGFNINLVMIWDTRYTELLQFLNGYVT